MVGAEGFEMVEPEYFATRLPSSKCKEISASS
jgi:hypothetical protein